MVSTGSCIIVIITLINPRPIEGFTNAAMEIKSVSLYIGCHCNKFIIHHNLSDNSSISNFIASLKTCQIIYYLGFHPFGKKFLY